MASLPVVQDSLVNHYRVLTNDQLNQAVVITRSTPGPVGLYSVSAGYFAAGLPGAVVGWLAMITPALLIIPRVHFVGRKIEHPRVKNVLQSVVIASAGLLLAAAVPLASDALTGRGQARGQCRGDSAFSPGTRVVARTTRNSRAQQS